MRSIGESTETPQLNIELIILTFSIDLCNLYALRVASVILLNIIVNTSMASPVLVDNHGRLKTQLYSVVTFLSLCMAMVCSKVVALPVITNQAFPLNIVSLSLEISYANAQVSQLIGELSSQFVNQSLVVVVSSLGLSHSLCNNLSHLITAHVLVTLESAISSIAVYNAILYQLSNSIICPMISRNISERISSCKSSGSSAYYQSGSQCGYESLLHKETSSFNKTNKPHLLKVNAKKP